ncbi:MAG: amidohydrolase [Desulfococcaceae bacterium]|jgi:5-methylthioadenosine/S-adenosylhomocysteine deaminase|nr:amidohydrolase [Desulfococcaceae bacterium]
MNYDTVIYNGTVITLNPDSDIVEKGVVCIREGKIDGIYQQKAGEELPKSPEKIDAEGGIIMPGLVNTHCHMPMTLFRGLADDLPLSQWLEEHIFPAEARHINPESVYWGTMLACAEMLLSGITACCDGYFLENHVAQAVQEMGIRAVLGQGIIDFPAPGVPRPEENVKHAKEFIQKWQNISPLIQPSLFCHSPYTCSARTLQKAKETADEMNVLFQIHAAETKWEREQMIREKGMSPIAYLHSLGIPDENTLLVHCVWTDAEDIDIIAESGAAVSHNPGSNMKLASGIAPVPDFLKAGIRVGLGTDGCASNNNLDLFQEMDMAAKLHKVSTGDPTVMNARTVLQMATLAGARSVGLGDRTGSLEVGKAADIIIADTEQPHLQPLYDPVSHLVYSADGSDVRDVLVAGKVLVKNRKLCSADMGKIMEKMLETAKSIREER